MTGLGQILGMVLMRMREGMPVNDGAYPASLVLQFIIYSLAAGFLVFALCLLFRKVDLTAAAEGKEIPERTALAERPAGWLTGLFIFLCWLPCWIAYFPAIYSYDGEPQLIQYTTGAFDNHHPVFHTLIMGWCYDLGQWITKLLPGESYLDGMAVYALIQSLFLIFAYTRVIRLAKLLGAGKIFSTMLILWFALFPVHPLMAITTTKDTMYTAALVLFLCALSEILFSVGNRLSLLEFALSGILMMLFRKNGLYLIGGLLLVLAAFLMAELTAQQNPVSYKNKRRIYCLLAAMCIGSIALASLAENVMIRATGAVQGESAEALSIPLQQLSRAYKSNTDDFTMEELETIAEYESLVGLNNYRPFISDAVKQGFNNEHFREDPAGFFKLWFRYGLKYPGPYVMAFLYHTMGAWYPEDISHTLVYEDWWRDRTGYLITDAIPVFAQRYVIKENFWPSCRDFYEKIATECAYRSIPLLRSLFSPYLYCAGTVLLVLACITGGKKERRNKRALLLVAVPLFVHYLMILAGPCVIARYIFPLMAALPVALIAACYGYRYNPGMIREKGNPST